MFRASDVRFAIDAVVMLLSDLVLTLMFSASDVRFATDAVVTLLRDLVLTLMLRP